MHRAVMLATARGEAGLAEVSLFASFLSMSFGAFLVLLVSVSFFFCHRAVIPKESSCRIIIKR